MTATENRFARRELLQRAGVLAVGAGLLPLARGARAATPDLDALQRSVSGTVVRQSGPGYDAARLLYSPRFDDVMPLAIVYCQSDLDVSRAIRWARDNYVRLAVRSGGHSYAGYSTLAGGLVLDVSRLTGITVDTGAGRATIGAGARLMDVYRELARHGVTISAGSCPSVGIAGLVLGGGIGVSSRKLGLTCDSLRSLTMVTAGGVIRKCTTQRNPDLLWAARGGGGGNFGVATRFTFTVHPVSSVAVYQAEWAWKDAAKVADAWQRWAPTAPDELFSVLGLAGTDSGATLVTSAGQFIGSAAGLQALLAPFLAAGAPPRKLEVRTMPYLDAMVHWAGCADQLHCRLGDGVGRSSYRAKSDYADALLPPEAIQVLLHSVEARAATPASGTVLLDSYGGAINRVAKDATAFVHRNALFSFQYLASWGQSGGEQAARSWLQSTWTKLRPFVSGAAYQNYIDADLERWALAYYGSNYPRLRKIKRQYDPNDVFHLAQGIVRSRA